MSLALAQKLAPLQLKRLLASNASADEDDVLNVKQRLNTAGHYEVPSYGMTRYPDNRPFDGITSFQHEQGLTVDGYMRPRGETETRLNQIYQQETTAPQKTLAKFFGPQKDLPKLAKKITLAAKNFSRRRNKEMIANATNPYKDLSLVALCLMPLFLNDFVYLDHPSAWLWLIIDWGSKILSGVFILLFSTTRHLALTSEARGFSFIEGLAITLMATVTWWISFELTPWANVLIPPAAQFAFTTYPSPSIRVIDLGLGLLLTAVVEEVLFRKVVFLALQRAGIGIAISGVLSVVLFALCHWSLGLGSCLSALLFGLGAQAIFIQTGRLLPLVAAHWAYDFFWFA